MLRIRHVEVFQALMRTRSVTRAAELLRSSQPTTSRYLGELEREVGFALFERTGMGLVPTPEAEALVLEVNRSFAGLDRIAAVARGIAEFRFDRLRIASISSVALGFLPSALTALRRRYPEVEILLHVGTFDEVVRNVLANQCEIGFVAYQVANTSLRQTPIVKANALCALPAGHHLATRDHVTIADLDGEPLIAILQDLPSGGEVARIFEEHGIARNIMLETQNGAVACAYVKQNLGVAILDPFTISALVDARMVARPFLPDIPFAFSALSRADRPLPRLCEELLVGLTDALRVSEIATSAAEDLGATYRQSFDKAAKQRPATRKAPLKS